MSDNTARQLQLLEELRKKQKEGEKRQGTAKEQIDLSGADLKGLDLNGLDLSGVNFAGADLSGCDLSAANLTKANLFNARLKGANLKEALLRLTNLNGADLTGANLDSVRAIRAGFGMACLDNATMFNARMELCSFSKASLKDADLRCANLKGSVMREADIQGADLTEARLEEADLSMAMVHWANFTNADLRRARLRLIQGYDRAKWIGTDIRDINFAGAYLMRRYVNDQNFLMEFKNHSPLSKFLYYIWLITSDCGRSMSRWCMWIFLQAWFFAWLYSIVGVDYGEHPTGLSNLYFSIVTLTTLGFGDVVPSNTAGQLVVMTEVITGYMMLGGLLSIFSNKMARRAD